MADFWQWQGDTTLGAGYVVLPKGSVSTVLSATLTATLTADTTYTSAETSIVNFNSILMQTVKDTAGKTAKVDLSGALSSGGVMAAVYDKDTSAQMTTGLLTQGRVQRFTGLPDYLGVSMILSAGMTAGSSAAVKIQPFNL